MVIIMNTHVLLTVRAGEQRVSVGMIRREQRATVAAQVLSGLCGRKLKRRRIDEQSIF